MTTTKRFTAVLATAVLFLDAAFGEDVVFRWASSGGGWRAQAAAMAYANVFTQAGLIRPDTGTSLFSAISTQSGASWFSTQLFYSQPFFQNTTTSTPDALRDFVLFWMNSYQTFSSENLTQNPSCEFNEEVRNTTLFEILSEYCNILLDYDGDWAAFIRAMYDATSTDYGDAGLADRAVNPENRVPPMSNTDLYIQTSLVANSRIRNTTSNDTVTYLGPSESGGFYSIPICVDWAVTGNNAFYFTNQPDQSDLSSPSWATYVGKTSKDFAFADWEDFFLFPGDSGTVSIPVLAGTTSSGNLQQPFFSGQVPTVGQIGSATSAAVGMMSGLVPSALAQFMSIARNRILTDSNRTVVEQGRDLAVLTKAINSVYQQQLADNLAVCTQWPAACGEDDGRFIDGYITDELTLALNIGLHHTLDGDLTKTLRVILTNNNFWENLPVSILAYFNTTFNQGVEPGAFVWPTVEDEHMTLPVFSPQIFGTYLDLDTLNNLSEPIEGLNVTMAFIKTTTIDNPAFKTKAGQPVEILFLSLNSNIPTSVVGETQIEMWKGPIADLARDIAESQVLLSRVESFMAGGTESEPSTSAGCMLHVDWILSSLLVLLVISVRR